MKPRRDEGRGWRRVLWITALGSAAGGVFDAARDYPTLSGAVSGAAAGAALSALEIFVLRRRALLRWPFAAYFTLRLAVYGGVVFAINGTPETATSTLDWSAVGFALLVSVIVNLVFSVNQLLGPGVLFAFAAGRYRRPRRERRIVLCADLTGSTALAERLGEERFLDLLNSFFDDLAAPIVRDGGEIHKFIGDELIATWPDGANPEQPIRACFSAQGQMVAGAERYRAAFGEVPTFRAAMHEGPVVLGELGATRKEIALIGDAMNVAARLLETARGAGAFLLVSGVLYERLAPSPPGLVAERLAPVTLRGKSTPLEIVSLREA